MAKKTRATHLMRHSQGKIGTLCGPAIYYASEADLTYTAHLKNVTCGSCKGVILERLRKADWSQLSDATLGALEGFLPEDEDDSATGSGW